ncbi:Epidermal growth factor receptor substrate 15 [Merluccius polli]|uniref:Epidermal growth factor receptor substrate 15 n=1 Tax=Merluccius polli TaxID=89951 RepID=A0AA47P8Q0_MERPO|nr:Epidermal growth factor receptor substrate 15 [Merluccius polli]
MAATLSLTQLSCGNPVYDKYYRQVDPTGSGRVAAADAALFLKRSGLADLVLGKVWDLADSERKGCLNKQVLLIICAYVEKAVVVLGFTKLASLFSSQQFFIALRLVACAQNGLEVGLKSLHLAVPPPKFHDTSSPLLPGGVAMDIPWVVKAEEKMKFDAIFDSLSPVGGFLTGDKVKPVLLNSKLPVDVLGRVWELSDIDRDGMLDRDEFAVAMYLVYRALEGEPVPMSLPPPLVAPSKRKKPSVPPAMPLLPSPPSTKDARSAHAKSAHHAPKPAPAPAPAPAPTPAAAPWVVSPSDKAKYDELFSKTDGDMDGLVSGPEVRDIFLKTGLPSATLARIWELCDIGDLGKLTREQFALALHLINQKLTKGLEPPQTLSPDMFPPSDRLSIKQNNMANLAADFSAIKELDSLSNEIVDLQREKSGVEQEIKEKEETIQLRSSEVQELQDEVSKESLTLQQLHGERQRIQEAVDELDREKSSLEEQLSHIRQQTSHESQLISSLQSEHEEQELTICQYEEELVQAREELLKLQEETRVLEEKVQAAREQLTPLQESVRDSFKQVTQVQQKLTDLRVEERSVTAQLSWKRALEDNSPILVNGSAGPTAELHHGDLFLVEDHPFYELKEDEDEEEEDEEEEVSPARSHPMKEQCEEPRKMEEEEKTDEGNEKTEGERPPTPEEKKAKQDALDDLYSSLASGDLYNSLGTISKAQDNNIIIMVGNPAEQLILHEMEPQRDSLAHENSSPTVESSPEVTDEKEESPSATPKVASPESESSEEAAESPEPISASPAETLPAQTSSQASKQTGVSAPPELGFFQSDPFTDHDPFKDDPFGKADVSDPFGEDPFKGTDPFAADTFFTAEDPFTSAAAADPFGTSSVGPAEPDPFGTKLNNVAGAPVTAPDPFATSLPSASTANDLFGTAAAGSVDLFGSQGNGDADPFSSSLPSAELPVKDATPTNDPFAPGGTAVSGSGSDPDPFAAVFGNESFGGGFADFSALAKSNGADAFGTNNKNIFQDDSPPTNSDVPPALPPKTGTPTRPPPPPPGKRSSISRTESSDSFHRRGHFHPQGSVDFPTSTTTSSSSSSLPAKDPMADPFAPSSPPRHTAREPERFASFDKQYPTEEDMIEWAKRESEREEKERLARLTQQEQEDLELAIALSKSELS